MYMYIYLFFFQGFPSDSEGKGSTCSAGNLGSIPGLGRSSGEENGNPLISLPAESHGQRSLGGLQSMGLQRVGHDWATIMFPSFFFRFFSLRYYYKILSAILC